MAREQHLNLWKQRLGRVPDEVWDNPELETLVLADNELTELSPRVGELRRLRMLDLGHNRLTAVPICEMAGLVELRAEGNQLAALPDCLGRLGRLRELHLRNNRLATLPNSIGALHALRHLDLRGNPLERLPEALARLPRLEKVDLRWVTTLEPTPWLDDLEARGCLVYR